MSFDLTIKGDKHYSRTTERAPLASFVSQLPRIKPNGTRGFALDDPPKVWMEIDLEVVSRNGDNVEVEGQVSESINCLRLHIPYSFLKSGSLEHDYLPIAIMIVDRLGWQLYDDQNDDPDEPMYP